MRDSARILCRPFRQQKASRSRAALPRVCTPQAVRWCQHHLPGHVSSPFRVRQVFGTAWRVTTVPVPSPRPGVAARSGGTGCGARRSPSNDRSTSASVGATRCHQLLGHRRDESPRVVCSAVAFVDPLAVITDGGGRGAAMRRTRFGVPDSNGHDHRAHGGRALDSHTRAV
jgi:hypothetical protein